MNLPRWLCSRLIIVFFFSFFFFGAKMDAVEREVANMLASVAFVPLVQIVEIRFIIRRRDDEGEKRAARTLAVESSYEVCIVSFFRSNLFIRYWSEVDGEIRVCAFPAEDGQTIFKVPLFQSRVEILFVNVRVIKILEKALLVLFKRDAAEDVHVARPQNGLRRDRRPIFNLLQICRKHNAALAFRLRRLLAAQFSEPFHDRHCLIAQHVEISENFYGCDCLE